MTSALATFNALFTTDHADQNRKSRLNGFAQWLDQNGKSWLDANLAEYRDYLLYTRKPPLAPISVRNHLATIRQRYRDLLEDNATIAMLESQAFMACQTEGYETNPANVQATVNRWLRFIGNNTSPRKVTVKIPKVMSEEDDRFIRLSPDQMKRYIESIPDDTLIGLRDRAVVALIYIGGLREQEAVDLTLDDADKYYRRKPALKIREGKGKKQRMVIVEPMAEFFPYITQWLTDAQIADGRILRSLGMKKEAGESLSTDAVQDVLKKYSVDGLKPRPHDLRRSYAKNLYDAGWKVEAIAEQMGHESVQTTLKYIGAIR